MFRKVSLLGFNSNVTRRYHHKADSIIHIRYHPKHIEVSAPHHCVKSWDMEPNDKKMKTVVNIVKNNTIIETDNDQQTEKMIIPKPFTLGKNIPRTLIINVHLVLIPSTVLGGLMSNTQDEYIEKRKVPIVISNKEE